MLAVLELFLDFTTQMHVNSIATLVLAVSSGRAAQYSMVCEAQGISYCAFVRCMTLIFGRPWFCAIFYLVPSSELAMMKDFACLGRLLFSFL